MTTTQPTSERKASAFSVPAFKWLWLNSASFFIVVNAQRFAFSWVVLDGLGRSEADQGIAVFLLGLPTMLFVLQAGAWADRYDRKRILMGTQIASAAVCGTVAAALGADKLTFGWLLIATLVSGTATTIGSPVRSSLVPAIVGPELLYSAIAVNAIAMTSSLVFGPVLVQAVGDRFGFDGAFWFLAIVMTFGFLALIRLKAPQHGELPPRRPIRTEITDAFRFINQHHELRSLFALLTLSSLTIAPAAMVTQQAHVAADMGRSAGDAAIPFMAMGTGIAISSTFIMRNGSMANKGLKFQLAMLGGGTTTGLIGLTSDFRTAIVLSLFMGLSGGFFINMNQGLIQAHTPEPLMGRVMGLYNLVSQGLFPVGALMLGLIGSQIGPGPAMTVAAVTALILVTTSIITNPRLRVIS